VSFDWRVAAQRLRAMAQTGLTYSQDRFDIERYRELEGISQAMLAELLSSTPASVAEAFVLERGYPTPKVDVRTATFSEGRVLLVKEWVDGGWTLPGGWADEGDSPRESAERECREESGFEVKVRKLVALRDRSRHDYLPRQLSSVYKLIFLAELGLRVRVGLFDERPNRSMLGAAMLLGARPRPALEGSVEGAGAIVAEPVGDFFDADLLA
jgi:ADP-ribose pyrophosphatase YjhB (NUDIX family)